MGENFLLVNTFFGNGRKETFAPAFVCESFSASHFLYFLPTLSPFPTGRGQRGVLPGADSERDCRAAQQDDGGSLLLAAHCQSLL